MDPQFTMTVRSDNEEIPAVSARLEESMRVSGFSGEAILDTQLAVEEAIANVIVHGYKGPGGEINISCTATRDRVIVQITDSAPRFDPTSVPEPDLEGSLDERTIGGLGIFLIRQVMDDISYRYENGRNILILVKKA